MKVTRITESGSNNILRWAITNNAKLKEHLPLSSIINDDMFYLVTVEGVNFYELFRLTQFYRNKMKICNVDRAAIPSVEILQECFPDHVNEVTNVLETFLGLVAQMTTDNDVIAEGAAKLFLPMITTNFTIQIPLSFIDIIESLNGDDLDKLINSDYPVSLETAIDNIPAISHMVLTVITRLTSNINYDSRYEQLLRTTKYFSLSTPEEKLFRTGLVGFSKFNPYTRGESRCNIFKADGESFKVSMDSISKTRGPLNISVVVQLPIYYMQLLEASYFPEDLKISYRSSINNILDNGAVFHDFNFNDGDEDRRVAINNYLVRISEANLNCLKLINELIKSPTANTTYQFAILPAAYQSNAVITFAAEDMPKFLEHGDPVIHEMFTSVNKIVKQIIADLQ